MKWRKVFLAVTAFSLMALGFQPASPTVAAPLGTVQVKAHRGGWLAYGAPEESLKALTAAANDGVDWIEFDVVYTRDLVAVVQHGDKIGGGSSGSATCTQAGAAIHAMTYAQIQQVRCDGEPIATLDQVLAMLATNPKARTTKVDIEVKTYSGQSLAGKKDWMRRTLQKTSGIHSRMSISTFSWRQLAATIKAYGPKTYFLALESASLVKLHKNADYANLRKAKKLGADGFGYAVTSSDVGGLKFARALGLEVHLYGFATSNQAKYAEAIRFAIANGQKVIGADNPNQLRALIASLKGQRPMPRLVVQSLKSKTVLATKSFTPSKRRYPQVFGSSGTVPSGAQNQFDSARLKVKITAKSSGGLLELAPRNSRVGRDGVRIKLKKGTHSYVVYVSPGDHGDLRVRTTKKVKLSVEVTGYRIARFG